MPTPRSLARLLTASALLATAMAVVLASPLPRSQQATASAPSTNCTETAPPLNGSVYEISTPGQLLSLARSVNSTSLSAAYRQTADLDLTNCGNWPGIGGGGATAPFTGTYDGDGNTILNLSISATGASWGLFRNIDDNNALVENLTLQDATVVAPSPTFNEFSYGALVGELRSGAIDNVTVLDADVFAHESVGGLIGRVLTSAAPATVTITNTNVSASATATRSAAKVGGVIGIVENNVSGGAVSISTTSSVGQVTGTNVNSNSIGGLIGEVFSNHAGLLVTVSASFSRVNTTGGQSIGGLIGYVYTNSSSGYFWLHDSYALGAVNSTLSSGGNHQAGGLLGATDGSGTSEVRHSFAAGPMASTESTVGGLIGKNWGNQASVVDSFWDTQTTTRSVSDGGVGKLTSELQTFSTFDTAGWSITDGPPLTTVWGFCDGTSYPFLIWQTQLAPDIPGATSCSAWTNNNTGGGGVVLPPAVSELVTQPIAPPTTTPSTTVPTTMSPLTTVAPTRDSPLPLLIDGELPELAAGDVMVVEDGEPVPVTVFVDNDTELVLEADTFELRLAGDCTAGACNIDTAPEGQAVLILEEDGSATTAGVGFQPGSRVDVWLFSEPRYLGELTVDADGTFRGNVKLSGIDAGEHTLQVNGTNQTGAERTANLGVIVNPTGAPTPEPGVLPATGNNTTPLWLIALLLLGIGLIITATRRRLTR